MIDFGWHPSSKLPPAHTAVVVYRPGGTMQIAYFDLDDYSWRSNESNERIWTPTHWTELPKRPT